MEFIKDVVVAFDEPDLFVPVIQLIFVDGGEFDSVGIVGKLFDGQNFIPILIDFLELKGFAKGNFIAIAVKQPF